MASTVVRLLTPRIPMLLKSTLLHTLGVAENSSQWDLKTTLVVTTIRSIMADSTSTISQQQAFSLKDPGIKKTEIIVKTTLATPQEDDIRQLSFRVINTIDSFAEGKYDLPALRPVEGEWTGYRPASDTTDLARLSDTERYAALQSTLTSPATILYFHGGAHYLMDPASHRGTTSRLARMTGGRAFSVRYRLAPQNPFPAALIDAFVAYLNLLYPPEGSLHEAVKAEHIVLAGDSAGGNLALALHLLLLEIGRGEKTVRWNGKEVEVPLPGGVATNSAWTDITRSLPSLQSNMKNDYLPGVVPTLETDSTAPTPKNPNAPPPCPVWPSPPPRADLYAPGALLCHPLVSPLAAPSEMWKGSSPMFFCVGEEMLSNEVEVVISRCVRAGVRCRWEGFEAMPHCFAMLLDGSKVSDKCFEGWAAWIKETVNGKEGHAKAGGTWFKAPTLEESAYPLDSVEERLTDEFVSKRMQTEMKRKIQAWEEGQQDSGNGVAKL